MERMRFKSIALTVFLITIGMYGQEKHKTYNEVFNVNAETILDINTSNVDIEFETWGKNQITVEANIVLEGATDEEAAAYFEHRGIEIVGNSEKVSITTGSENPWVFKHATGGLEHFNISIPDFDFDFEMPIMPEVPELDLAELHLDLSDMPMPPVPEVEFDYEAYQKEGEKYLKKWQKKFDKGFDKEYEEKMEAWGAKMEARQEAMRKRREEMMEQRMEAQEKRMEAKAEAREKRAEIIEKKAKEMEERREQIFEIRERHENEPNIFYYSTDGENKRFKVKKTIKVKMPKSIKIQMNVRHGAVKLAETTKNINARLSYSTLSAMTIDGEETTIMTSYSPVQVERWNYGALQTSYSEKVDLNEVLDLRLSATSSDVTIHRLLESAIIDNKMGPLKINSVSDGFRDIDISLQNAEMTCNLPETDFVIAVKSNLSKVAYPQNLELQTTKQNNTVLYKGFQGDGSSSRSININSKYSDVVLK